MSSGLFHLQLWKVFSYFVPNGGIFAFTSVRNPFTEMHNDMHLHSGSPYRLCIKYSTSHVSIAQGNEH